jgi:hypothetical protein
MEVPMSESSKNNEQSHELDPEEKKVAATAIRLPIIILAAVLLMLGAGVLAMQMHGG